MFSKNFSRWIAGGALTMALAASLVGGTGSASAQSVTASLTATNVSSSARLGAAGSAEVAAGTMLTINGTSFEADEPISFWVNVPDGVAIPAYSLGQDNSYIEGTVIPLDAMTSADANGAFTYSLNTSGLPVGAYSLVAHGLRSGTEGVFIFTINSTPAPERLVVEGDATVAAGTMLTINGNSFEANEPVGLWINIPDGAAIPVSSLGQDNTTVDGTVVPLNAMASADANGAFTYTLDTTTLPSGSYSLVAHGLNSKIEGVIAFTIK